MAGFLVHLSLGTIYTFGNIVPYVVSYIRLRSHPYDLSADTGAWIFALAGAGQGGSMFFGGWLERKIGPRFSTLAGGWLMSAGVLLSYFTIKVSFWLLLLTYGLVFGLGVGIAYVGPLSCAMRWMPRWKGIAGGFIVAGFGLGALIFDQVQSHYINPHNLKPTNGYFTDPDLLDRVPFVFLILGGSYAVMQFIGSILIVNPPHDFEQLRSTQQPSKQVVLNNTDHKWRDGKVLTNDDQQVPEREVITPLPTTDEQTVDSDASSSSEEEGENASLLTPNGSNLQKNHKSLTRAEGGRFIPRNSSPSQPSAPLIEVISVHPLQMLRTLSFYHLWSMMLLAGFSVSFIATLFKVFGLTFIDDDQFLATVGSISAVLNCTGRIVWGLVADKFSYRFALVSQSGIMTMFLLTFYATSAVGKPMFFIWVCVIFFCVGGVFSLYPTAIATSFGPKYMSINYGLLFTSQVCAGVIAALLFTTLQNLLDWDGMIFLISGFSMAGFVLALLYYYKQHCRCPPGHLHQNREQ